MNGGTVFAKSRACKSSLREREARFADTVCRKDENIHRSSDKLSSLFARNYLCPPTKTTARLSRILRHRASFDKPRSLLLFRAYVPYRSLAYMPDFPRLLMNRCWREAVLVCFPSSIDAHEWILEERKKVCERHTLVHPLQFPKYKHKIIPLRITSRCSFTAFASTSDSQRE